MQDLIDAVVDFISSQLVPAAVTILTAMLGVVAVFVVWRYIRRALGR